MTGPEHYAEAEKLLGHLDSIPDPHGDGSHAVNLIAAEAQVHATLALVMAIADPLGYGGRSDSQWTQVTR